MERFNVVWLGVLLFVVVPGMLAVVVTQTVTEIWRGGGDMRAWTALVLAAWSLVGLAAVAWTVWAKHSLTIRRKDP